MKERKPKVINKLVELHEKYLQLLATDWDLDSLINDKLIEAEENLKRYIKSHNESVTLYRNNVLQAAIDVSSIYIYKY